MKRFWLIVVLTLVLSPAAAFAQASVQDCYNGVAGLGGQIVTVNGIQAAQTVVVTYPGATVNVYQHGTTNLATIFQDPAAQNPITQPWTASQATAGAYWCAADGFYDVQYSGLGIAVPFTISDIHLAFNTGGGGGGSGITTVVTNSASGLTNSITGTQLTLAIASSGCGIGNTQIWNGTAWACGSPSSWSSLTSPTGNLNLALSSGGVAYQSIFTVGDFQLTPIASTSGAFAITDSAVSTTDNSANLYVGTGNGSYHNPFVVSLTTGGATFAQLGVYNTGGTSHVGITVVGNVISPANLSTTPYSKEWNLDGSNHTSLTLYNNNASQTNPEMRFHTVSSGTGFNFWQACSGATANSDGSCPSANNVAWLRGDGQLAAANFINLAGTGVSLNGVTLTGQPTGTSQCITSTSTSTATWQGCSGGGGGGGTGAQWQTAYYSAANTLGAFGPGITGQTVVSQGASAAPVFNSAGVSGATKATSTYLVQCDSATTTIDRLTTLLATYSGTATWTIPDAGSSGCGANFTFAILVATGTTVTVNRTSTSTFTTLTGSAYTSGLTTFNLTAGQYATFSSPDNTNYFVRINAGGSGGSSLWSALGNPNASLTLSMTGYTSTFNYSSGLTGAMLYANTTTANVSTTNSSPQTALAANYWTGSASAGDTWSFQSSLAAGTNGGSTLNIAHNGSSGTAAVSIPNLIVTGSTQYYIPCAGGAGTWSYINPSTSSYVLTSNGAGSCPTFQPASGGGSLVFPLTVASGVSGGIGYFSSSTVFAASAAGTINTLMKWGGAGNPPVSSSITDAGTTIVAAEGLQFSGSSGAATTISTSTSNANLVLAPNGTGTVVLNSGVAAHPSLTFAVSASYGFYSLSSTNIGLGAGTSTDPINFVSNGTIRVVSGGTYSLSSSSTDGSTIADTAISRSSAGVLAVGNGTSGDTTGKVKAAAYMSVGTTFTTNAGCSETTLVGGATAGTFTLGANSCSVIITMGNSSTAPHGWFCGGTQDLAGVTNQLGIHQTAYTATTATLAFSSAPQSGDVIVFGCTGF